MNRRDELKELTIACYEANPFNFDDACLCLITDMVYTIVKHKLPFLFKTIYGNEENSKRLRDKYYDDIYRNIPKLRKPQKPYTSFDEMIKATRTKDGGIYLLNSSYLFNGELSCLYKRKKTLRSVFYGPGFNSNNDSHHRTANLILSYWRELIETNKGLTDDLKDKINLWEKMIYVEKTLDSLEDAIFNALLIKVSNHDYHDKDGQLALLFDAYHSSFKTYINHLNGSKELFKYIRKYLEGYLSNFGVVIPNGVVDYKATSIAFCCIKDQKKERLVNYD